MIVRAQSEVDRWVQPRSGQTMKLVCAASLLSVQHLFRIKSKDWSIVRLDYGCLSPTDLIRYYAQITFLSASLQLISRCCVGVGGLSPRCVSVSYSGWRSISDGSSGSNASEKDTDLSSNSGGYTLHHSYIIIKTVALYPC